MKESICLILSFDPPFFQVLGDFASCEDISEFSFCAKFLSLLCSFPKKVVLDGFRFFPLFFWGGVFLFLKVFSFFSQPTNPLLTDLQPSEEMDELKGAIAQIVGTVEKAPQAIPRFEEVGRAGCVVF